MKINSIQNNNIRFEATLPKAKRANIGIRTLSKSGSERTKAVIRRAARDTYDQGEQYLFISDRMAKMIRSRIHEENEKHLHRLRERWQNDRFVTNYDPERLAGLKALEDFKANNGVIPNAEALCELVPVLMAKDYRLINEPINDYGISAIEAFTMINPEVVDKDLYKSVIDYMIERPSIDFNVKDPVNIPLIEKVLLSENPNMVDVAIAASNNYAPIEYYPILDNIFENMNSEELKTKLKENLNVIFPDIDKAFELKSLEALKKLECQFNSPFYKKG